VAIRASLPEISGAASQVLREAKIREGETDVLEGSPPCASFSTAGKRSKTWGQVRKYSDTEQRVDDLFFEYTRLVKGIQPKVLVAENVSGLVKGVAKGFFKEIFSELQKCGYEVKAKVLDAQWLGVPQARQRLFFIGVRNDLASKLDIHPAFPKPLPYRYSVKEAIPWIESAKEVTSGAWGMGDITNKASPTVKARGIRHLKATEICPWKLQPEWDKVVDTKKPSPTILTASRGITGLVIKARRGKQFEWVNRNLDSPFPTVDTNSDNLTLGPPISQYAIGKEWGKLRPGTASKKYFNLVRPSKDKPCPTVTQTGSVIGAASVTHPTECRKFTIPELKRICGFPDDFQLTGRYSQQWERLGRAVPPPMMKAIAETIRDEILRKT